MKSSEYINELKEISPLLASIEKKNIFSVPEDYFINLNKQIINRIDNEVSSVFATSENHTLKVPEGYFENLAGNILQKIKSIDLENTANEIKQLSPMLYSIRSKNVFKIPEGYFEHLANDLLRKVSQKPAKVVPLKRNYFWNYAAAAVITGIITLSSLWVLNKPFKQSITGQVTETAFTPSSLIQESFNYKNEQQIEEGISKLSKEDIMKYLEVTDSDLDNEDVTTSIGEKDLPAEEEYLLDEKTLEKYLDQLELKPSGKLKN